MSPAVSFWRTQLAMPFHFDDVAFWIRVPAVALQDSADRFSLALVVFDLPSRLLLDFCNFLVNPLVSDLLLSLHCLLELLFVLDHEVSELLVLKTASYRVLSEQVDRGFLDSYIVGTVLRDTYNFLAGWIFTKFKYSKQIVSVQTPNEISA